MECLPCLINSDLTKVWDFSSKRKTRHKMCSLDRWIHLTSDKMKCSIMYNIGQKNAEVVCIQPAFCRWTTGFHLAPEGLTKALFRRPYNQTSHASGERGEAWATCNDQHIPGLSGIPAVKSPVVCTDPQPRNTWKPFVWGWGSEQRDTRPPSQTSPIITVCGQSVRVLV